MGNSSFEQRLRAARMLGSSADQQPPRHPFLDRFERVLRGSYGNHIPSDFMEILEGSRAPTRKEIESFAMHCGAESGQEQFTREGLDYRRAFVAKPPSVEACASAKPARRGAHASTAWSEAWNEILEKRCLQDRKILLEEADWLSKGTRRVSVSGLILQLFARSSDYTLAREILRVDGAVVKTLKDDERRRRCLEILDKMLNKVQATDDERVTIIKLFEQQVDRATNAPERGR